MNAAMQFARNRIVPRTGAIETTIAGQRRYCISAAQRNVHVMSEAAAVLVAAPFSFWLAAQPTLPQWARVLSATIGAGTLLVDGGLLLSYLKKESNNAGR